MGSSASGGAQTILGGAPHRCIFSTAGQAAHKAADVVHCPLADILGRCGPLPIHEEAPRGAWVGGRVLLGLWPALSYAPTPVC